MSDRFTPAARVSAASEGNFAGRGGGGRQQHLLVRKRRWHDRRVPLANLTAVKTLASGQNGPEGVAVDSSHIYWANINDGTIMKANLDGTGGVTTLASSQNTPAGVAVDGSHIYWANFATGISAARTAIMKANLDGTGVTTLVSTPGPCPYGVAVNGSHIYWADFSSGFRRIGPGRQPGRHRRDHASL